MIAAAITIIDAGCFLKVPCIYEMALASALFFFFLPLSSNLTPLADAKSFDVGFFLSIPMQKSNVQFSICKAHNAHALCKWPGEIDCYSIGCPTRHWARCEKLNTERMASTSFSSISLLRDNLEKDGLNNVYHQLSSTSDDLAHLPWNLPFQSRVTILLYTSSAKPCESMAQPWWDRFTGRQPR